MPRSVTVGFDGSPESCAAAEWAAREAKLRGLPLKLVNVREPVPAPMAQAPLPGIETQRHRNERNAMGAPAAQDRGRITRESVEGQRLRHPGVEITAEQLSGRPGEVLAHLADAPEGVELHRRTAEGPARKVLLDASADAGLLVVGAQWRHGHFGLQIGRVAHAVLHHSACPVAVVPQRA
jgi:nucleotide-binding universal stress UspA family protein